MAPAWRVASYISSMVGVEAGGGGAQRQPGRERSRGPPSKRNGEREPIVDAGQVSKLRAINPMLRGAPPFVPRRRARTTGCIIREMVSARP